MIITKNVNEMFRTVLVLSALLSTASAVDCNGKSFHCVNSTHFMICVDLGGGVSQAIDNFFIACPPPTVCQGTNHFECEFPAPTTLSNVISETTLPWDDVVTDSSTGNATKEFLENYMNTKRITAAVEYSITTEKAVDSTAATASEFYVNSELSIPEIVPTLAPEIASTDFETTQTVKENQNITEYVPTVAPDITEKVTQSATKRKNFTETEPVVVEDITTAVIDTTTENIIITDTKTAKTDYIVSSATEPVPVNENLNISKYVPSVVADITTEVIATVTQSSTESKNLTVTEPVVVDDPTTAVIDTTTENIIITDTKTAETDYSVSSATEQVPVNENLNISKYVPSVVADITTEVIATVTQSSTESKNLTVTEPVVVDDITTSVIDTTTENITITDTKTAETEYSVPSGTEQVPENENRNISKYVPTVVADITTEIIATVTQSSTESKNLTATEPVVVDDITTAVIDTTTENIIITDTKTAETDYSVSSATEQVLVNENLNISKYVPSVVADITTEVIATVTQSSTESKNLTVTEPVVVDDITTAVIDTTTENIIITYTKTAETDYSVSSATEQVPVNKNLNISKYVPSVVADITTEIIATVTQSSTESKNLTVTESVVVDDITTAIIDTATENIIITDTKTAETEYSVSSGTEQVPENENRNISKYVPTVVADITTDVIATVTQSSTESKNLTATEPVVVDYITTTVVETTTEYISIADTITVETEYVGPSVTEQIPQTVNENLNITEYVSTVVPVDITTDVTETVTQSAAESKNSTETEPVVNDYDTTAAIETITENTIITDTLAAKKEYVAASATEQVPQTIIENLNITVTVPSGVAEDVTTTNIETVTQTTAGSGNITETEHVVVDKVTATIIETTTDNIIITDSLGTELGHVEPTATEQVAQFTNDNLLELETVQSMTGPPQVTVLLKNISVIDNTLLKELSIDLKKGLTMKKAISSTANNITATNVNKVTILKTKNTTKADNVVQDILPVQKERVNVSESSNPSTLVKGSGRSNASIVINKQNPAETTVLGGIWTETGDNGAGTAQPTTINEESLTTDTTLNVVTENIIIPTTQGVNLEIITTDAVPTMTSNALTMPTAFEDTVRIESPLSVTENIVSTINNGASTNHIFDGNEFISAKAFDRDMITTDVMYMPTTDSNGQGLAFEDIMKTEAPLSATESIISSVNNGASTNGIMTSQLVNVDILNTEAMYVPTPISNAQPILPAFEDNVATNVPLHASENILSLVNNGASSNGLATVQAVNVDIINTEAMYIPTTISNAPPMATAFEDNVAIDVSLPATENIISSLTNGASTKDLETEQAVNVNIINTELLYIPTTISDVPSTAPAFEDSVTSNVSLSTTERQRVDIQTTQTILSISTDTGVKLEAIESVVNDNYHDNKMTTIDTHYMFEIGEQHLINNIPNSTVDVDIDESISHVSQTGVRNIENTLFPNAHYNQNEVMTTINTVTVNGKPTLENVNEQPSVHNIVILQKDSLPVKNNIVKATTTKSIPAFSFDSAFDISNQNLMSPQGESKPKEANSSEADNIIWNPLTNLVLDNGIQKSEFMGTFNVTNINAEASDRITTSLNTELVFQQTTTSPVITGSPINANINDSEQSINSILIQGSIGLTGLKDISETNGDAENIAKVNSVPDTDYRLNNQSEVPETTDTSNLKTNVGTDLSSALKSLLGKTSVADITILDGIKNEYRPIDNSFSHPSTSTIDKTDINTLSKSGSNAEISSDNQEKINAKSNRGTPIVSISITSDNGVLTDLTSNTQAENIAISSVSHDYESLKHIFAATGTKDGVNVGHITTVPRIGDPDINFQMGVTERNSFAITVPTIAGSTSGSQTSVFAKKVSRNGDAIFNSQLRPIDGADVLLQPTQVEQIPNKKANAPNNAHLILDAKSSGSGTNTDYSHHIHSSISSNNGNTGTTSESVSQSNYESHKSENIIPQESVFSVVNQKGNSTVATDSKFASQNISSNTENVINSIGGDNKQSEVTQQNNSFTNITLSISTQAQNIYTSTARTPAQMVTPNPISHFNNDLNKQLPTDAALTFSCINGVRGRYSDKDDCRKFYICIGNNGPIVGNCPENTVFSDLKKLCTKNMSHCIREDQFKCPSAGRFSDFIKDNIYYICVNHKNTLYRFKFQCQTGYVLDKMTVKCIETKETESNESVSISSSDISSRTGSNAISSSTSSNTISTSSTSNSSNTANDTSKNDNSSNSKKSNEAETSEKSEGKDDDEDEEVLKCKKEGKFPIDNECRRYYLCKKNRKSEYRRKIKKCNSGKVFHKDKKKCVDDDSYEC